MKNLKQPSNNEKEQTKSDGFFFHEGIVYTTHGIKVFYQNFEKWKEKKVTWSLFNMYCQTG